MLLVIFWLLMQVIAITVEDEEDIPKLKDYSPSASDGAPAAKGPSTSTEPPPPKEEAVEETVSSPEPKTSKPSATPSEGRIFASPLARKLAEDHNVWL